MRASGQRWNRLGFSRADPTGKFQNHRRLTGWSIGRLTGLMQNFQKGGRHGWGVKICDFRRGSLTKKSKTFLRFCKNDSILRPFLVKFPFERPVLSSAKRAQNKHKKHWRAQAKLLNVLSNDILRKAKKWSYNFLVIGDRLFADRQTLNFFSAVLPLQLQKDKWEKNNSRRQVTVKTYEHHNTCTIIPKTIKWWSRAITLYNNQIFHYTRWITPKRVTSWRGPSPRHWSQATQLLSKKCRNGGEPLATLCPIWPARDLNLRLPAPETNALPLDQ